MARRVIEPLPMIPFLKAKEIFAVPGRKFIGLFQKSFPSTGQFGGTNYQFTLDKEGNQGVLTANSALERQLAAAALRLNEKVTIEFTGYQNTKNGEMRLFTVTVDDPPANPPAPKAAEPPKPGTPEDIAF